MHIVCLNPYDLMKMKSILHDKHKLHIDSFDLHIFKRYASFFREIKKFQVALYLNDFLNVVCGRAFTLA